MLNKKGFTMIEFMISITVFFILVSMSFANYMFFQNIAKVKISQKEVSQSINTAKNLAFGGLDISGKNQSIYLNLKIGENKIDIYSIDYDDISSNFDFSIDKYKIQELQDNINISKLYSTSINYDDILIYFPAIKGDIKIYSVDSFGNLTEIGSNILNIGLSYKTANSSPLYKELNYNKLTNIVDY